MLTLESFTKKVEDGGYGTEGFARRALNRTLLTKKEKAQGGKLIKQYFRTQANGSEKAAQRKPKRIKIANGHNGLAPDGEGDCLAVTMLELILDENSRDRANRLLSQAREENLTIQELSARFSRICQTYNEKR